MLMVLAFHFPVSVLVLICNSIITLQNAKSRKLVLISPAYFSISLLPVNVTSWVMVAKTGSFPVRVVKPIAATSDLRRCSFISQCVVAARRAFWASNIVIKLPFQSHNPAAMLAIGASVSESGHYITSVTTTPDHIRVAFSGWRRIFNNGYPSSLRESSDSSNPSSTRLNSLELTAL